MKIVYCIHSTSNSGGMERVLLNKVNYLAAERGYSITIVTTDQKGRPSFFAVHPSVRFIDLGLNYCDDLSKGVFAKGAAFFAKRRQHKKKMTRLLHELKPDVVVSTFGTEATFLPDIHDGSKKVVEIHFSKFFRLQYERKHLWVLVDKMRSRWDERIVRRFDKFVVLTHEDKENWGNSPNMEVIHNSVVGKPAERASLHTRTAVAVGRLSFQKGYDYLIMAWKKVAERFPDWQLDIYGDGELRDELDALIRREGLKDKVRLRGVTKDIPSVLTNSAFLVMSSRYEGMPMVLLEAFTYGLPVVSFACKCGPRDIITDGADGLLVEQGDVDGLANSMMRLMADESLRRSMGGQAAVKATRFSQDEIMNQWTLLFEGLAHS